MTDTPTPIEPQDIRVGDIIRAENVSQVCTIIYKAPVTNTGLGFVVLGTDDSPARWSLPYDGYTWTLISRPTPPREPGTLWRLADPESLWVKVAYGSDDNAGDYRQVSGVQVSDGFLVGDYDVDAKIIRRLTPVEPPEVAEMRRELAAEFSKRADSHCQTPGYLPGYISGLRDAAVIALGDPEPQP